MRVPPETRMSFPEPCMVFPETCMSFPQPCVFFQKHACLSRNHAWFSRNTHVFSRTMLVGKWPTLLALLRPIAISIRDRDWISVDVEHVITSTGPARRIYAGGHDHFLENMSIQALFTIQAEKLFRKS